MGSDGVMGAGEAGTVRASAEPTEHGRRVRVCSGLLAPAKPLARSAFLLAFPLARARGSSTSFLASASRIRMLQSEHQG